MTPDQEKAVTEALAEGLSEREAAKRTGVNASSVHRLRQKLAAQPQQQPADVDDQAAVMDADLADAELTELTRVRGEITEALQGQIARAESSAGAVQDLLQQKEDRLAAGLDAADLRPRLRNAEDDFADWARSVALLRQRLAGVDGRIAVLNGREELAARRARMDAASAAEAGVYAASGGRIEAAVTASAAAAQELIAVHEAEQSATTEASAARAAYAELATQLGEPIPPIAAPVSTWPSVRPDAPSGPELALLQAMQNARRGNLTAVATALGLANGWLPAADGPDPAELERWRQMTADREAELERLQAANQRGPVDVDDKHVPVTTDGFGRPLNRYGEELVVRGSLPNPRGWLQFPDPPPYESIFRQSGG